MLQAEEMVKWSTVRIVEVNCLKEPLIVQNAGRLWSLWLDLSWQLGVKGSSHG